MILELDNCDNPQAMIHNAMLDRVFIEFVDNCLRVVEPNEM